VLKFLRENISSQCHSRLLLGALVALSVLPVVIAVLYTSHVPRVDDWGLVIEPYFRWQDGAGWLSFLHSAGNDSRHHAAQFIHSITLIWFAWDPVIESLICVGLGILAALVTVKWWMGQMRYKPSWWSLLAGVLSVLLILSPQQWMNWSWGIQICYMLPIASTLLVFWFLTQTWSLGKRVGWALIPCWVAVFSFANGWLAVVLGGMWLGWQVHREGWRPSGLKALLVWAVSALCAGMLYLYEWPESKGLGDEGLLERLIEAPVETLVFFAQVLGAPLSDVGIFDKRVIRVAVQGRVAMAVSLISGLVLAGCLLHLWKRRTKWSPTEVAPWILLVAWGVANTAAITLARVGEGGYGPFQSRYPGFTCLFFVGLLGLLCMTEGIAWRRIRWGFLMLASIGAGVSGVQGWWDVQRVSRSIHAGEAAVSLRHVAPEPVFLEASRPSRTTDTVELLDRLEKSGLLHVKTIMSEWVDESVMSEEAWATGEVLEASKVEGGVKLTGWAINPKTKGPVKAVLLSYQVPGGRERWMGLAGKATVMNQRTARLGARVIENRIGWVYEPLTGEETAFMRKRKLQLKRKPMPSGELIFRAYAFDPVTGELTRLKGVMAAIIDGDTAP
jgi:hypothetical protein